MSVVVALELDLRREELHAAVGELTDESKQQTPDGGRAVVPALLEQVEELLTDSSGAGYRATTLPGTRVPIRLSALELLVEVDATTGHRAGRSRPDELRAWASRVGARGSLGDVADAADLAARWTSIARGVLAPARPRIGLRGASCPSCGARTVAGPGSAGERVVEPALLVDTRTGTASCTAADCGAWWSTELLGALAAQLAAQTAHEHLAEP